MPKPSKAGRKAASLRLEVDEYISRQGAATFNYKQVSTAIGHRSPASQRTIALHLAELAFDEIGRASCRERV